MGHLEWSDRDAVERSDPLGSSVDAPAAPVLVAAFEGWSDAADAATGAVEHLWEQWGARTIASIDAEEFYDFTAVRPRVRIDAGRRVVDWPANEFGWAEPSGTDGVLLLRGVEPQLRWRTFCDQVLEVAQVLGCRWVVSVGALLSDVPHTRPTPIFGTSDDDSIRQRFDLSRSGYEGPTGILGALHCACASIDVPTASLWAAVPSYAPSATSPKATAALVTGITGLVGAEADTSVLELGAVSYEHQLDELIADDDATREYVHLLERQQDSAEGVAPLSGSSGDTGGTVSDADRLLDEVERFLRDQ